MSITRVDKTETYDVFIGRPSKFSNPFKRGIDGTKSEVITKFEEYFKNLPNLDNLLDELEGKRIACWCPLETPCHSDVIIKLYNERLKLKYLESIID